MIDIHCHILPNIDDGARNLNMSLAMGRLAMEDGITDIVATPHFSELFHYDINIIDEKIAMLQEKFTENNININIHYGLEVQLHAEIIDKFSDRIEDLTINKMGKYILLELPFIDIPLFTNDIIRYFTSSDITPVIVHPLRNARIYSDVSLLYSLRDNGALFQFDKDAIIDNYNFKTFHIFKKLLKKQFVQFIASDAHRIDKRRPVLKTTFNKIENNFNYNIAYQLFYENPKNLIEGKEIKTLPLNNMNFFDKIKNIFNNKEEI